MKQVVKARAARIEGAWVYGIFWRAVILYGYVEYFEGLPEYDGVLH